MEADNRVLTDFIKHIKKGSPMKLDVINQNVLNRQVEALGSQARKSSEKKELEEAVQGFEAIFMHSLLKSMRATLPGDALFEKSHAMGIFESMQDQYLAEELSKSPNATGIGKFLYDELKDTIS
jgi:flagellar protein FlgJ